MTKYFLWTTGKITNNKLIIIVWKNITTKILKMMIYNPELVGYTFTHVYLLAFTTM